MSLFVPKNDPALYIPTRNSYADEWIEWYKTLKSYFNTKTANQIWLKAWAMRGTSAANVNSLREFMEKQGIQIEANAIATLRDNAEDAFDFVTSPLVVGRYFAIGAGVILLVGVGMVVYNIGKNPAASAGLAARAFVTKGK